MDTYRTYSSLPPSTRVRSSGWSEAFTLLARQPHATAAYSGASGPGGARNSAARVHSCRAHHWRRMALGKRAASDTGRATACAGSRYHPQTTLRPAQPPAPPNRSRCRRPFLLSPPAAQSPRHSPQPRTSVHGRGAQLAARLLPAPVAVATRHPFRLARRQASVQGGYGARWNGGLLPYVPPPHAHPAPAPAYRASEPKPQAPKTRLRRRKWVGRISGGLCPCVTPLPPIHLASTPPANCPHVCLPKPWRCQASPPPLCSRTPLNVQRDAM
jgi:hypothetical protein